jgi:hypothetical protein
MTEEQKNAIKQIVEHARATADEIDQMLADYDQCKSETSRKYLGAAILKTAQTLRPSAQ